MDGMIAESSSDDEERFRSRAELYRMNQRAQLVTHFIEAVSYMCVCMYVYMYL